MDGGMRRHTLCKGEISRLSGAPTIGPVLMLMAS